MMSRIDSRHWTISTGRPFQNGRHNIAKIQHCPISSQFDMWVDKLIPDIEQCPVALFKMADTISIHQNLYVGRWIDSRHWTISTGRHFQNDRYNIAKIQLCSISSKFDMWVDNNILNWFQIFKNFYWSPFSKWPSQLCKNSTLSDIITIWYVGR